MGCSEKKQALEKVSKVTRAVPRSEPADCLVQRHLNRLEIKNSKIASIQLFRGEGQLLTPVSENFMQLVAFAFLTFNSILAEN